MNSCARWFPRCSQRRFPPGFVNISFTCAHKTLSHVMYYMIFQARTSNRLSATGEASSNQSPIAPRLWSGKTSTDERSTRCCSSGTGKVSVALQGVRTHVLLQIYASAVVHLRSCVYFFIYHVSHMCAHMCDT